MNSQERQHCGNYKITRCSWEYYNYVLEHPIEKWGIPTEILYTGQDNMTDMGVIDKFVKRFGCRVTVYEKGEHWFHTDEQVRVLHSWLAVNI